MRKIKVNIFLILMLGSLIFSPFSNSSLLCNSKNYDDHVVIVKFKPNSEIFKLLRNSVPKTISESLDSKNSSLTNPKINKFFSEYNIASIKAVKPDATEKPLPGGVERIFIMQLTDANSSETIKSLKSTRDIEYTEYDYFAYLDDKKYINAQTYSRFFNTPNDPYFYKQWGLKNTGQSIDGRAGVPGADINILSAWQITTGNSETIVAILDSGIPLNNPDLTGRIQSGYDFVNNDNNPQDDEGHGTAVTGIIAANGNNNLMISGINWNCKILPVKIFNSEGRSKFSNWIRGFIFATDNGSSVINISSASPVDSSHAIQDAIIYSYNHGVIVVTAMGNNNNNSFIIPAAYSNVIAAGALNNMNRRADFSNFGRFIDFIAPGEAIYTLYNLDPNHISDHYGTSMSTAFVTGLVSLMLGLKKDLTFQDVYGLLKKGAKDQIGNPSEDTPGWDQYYGWGCIDAGKTLQALIDTNIVHEIPGTYTLSQNYPNPFNLSTTIEFGIPNDELVNLSIFDMLGRKIMTLVDMNKKAGKYVVYWDANGWASDVYFCVLQTNETRIAKKMVLVK